MNYATINTYFALKCTLVVHLGPFLYLKLINLTYFVITVELLSKYNTEKFQQSFLLLVSISGDQTFKKWLDKTKPIVQEDFYILHISPVGGGPACYLEEKEKLSNLDKYSVLSYGRSLLVTVRLVSQY